MNILSYYTTTKLNGLEMKINNEMNNYRVKINNEMNMRIAIQYVLDKQKCAIYSGSCGIDGKNDLEYIVRLFKNDQDIFNKHSGFLARVNLVSIMKKEIWRSNQLNQLILIADGMSNYYAQEGFRNFYSVNERDNDYLITYLIGTISPVDGHKYCWNEKDRKGYEMYVLESIVNLVKRNSLHGDEAVFVSQQTF